MKFNIQTRLRGYPKVCKSVLFCQRRTYITFSLWRIVLSFHFKAINHFMWVDLTLEGDSSCIHSLSFKCEGLANIWVCSSSEMCKKNNNVVLVKQEMETSLYFLNVCGLCRRENISIDKFVTNHALPLREDWWETDRAGFDAWTDASVFWETCEMKVVTHVGPLPAGTLFSTWNARGFTICTVKAQLCFAEWTCVCKVLWSRGRS